MPKSTRQLALDACLYQDGKTIRLHAAVVMPDHVHIPFTCLAASDGRTYSFAEIVGPIKSFSAHAINKFLGRTGTVWLDESFDHVVRSEERLVEKIEYLRNNPVRAGLVNRPDQYPWIWIEIDAQPRTAVPH